MLYSEESDNNEVTALRLPQYWCLARAPDAEHGVADAAVHLRASRIRNRLRRGQRNSKGAAQCSQRYN